MDAFDPHPSFLFAPVNEDSVGNFGIYALAGFCLGIVCFPFPLAWVASWVLVAPDDRTDLKSAGLGIVFAYCMDQALGPLLWVWGAAVTSGVLEVFVTAPFYSSPAYVGGRQLRTRTT